MMEKKSPSVSVIIPVFNPGEGIKKCLYSVQNQTLKDIEIIIIDDLGTDNSMEEVRNAAKNDPRIVILVNDVNSGAGYSRNRGIEASTGDYLSFIDPDDYISEDFLELLYKKAEKTNADIVKGRPEHIDIHGVINNKDASTPLNAVIRAGLLAKKPIFSLFTYNHWTAIFRREMIMKTGARYGLARNSQDTVFLLRACYDAKSLEIEENAIYYYVSREKSRMRDCSEFRLQQELISMKELVSFFQQRYNGSRSQREYLCSKLRYLLCVQTWAMQTDGMRDAAERFLNEVRTFVCSLPFAEDLKKTSPIISILMTYGYNLSIETYRIQGLQQSIFSYVETATRWADFMEKYPENQTNKLLAYSWKKIYVQALTNSRLGKNGLSWSEKRRYYKELRKPTKKVKNTSMLKQSKTIRLFLLTGINFFAVKRVIKSVVVKFLTPRKKGKK